MSEQRRFVFLAVTMMTLVGLVAGALVFLDREDEERTAEKSTSKTVELSDTQKRQIELTSKEFLFVVGNWGIRADQVNENTIGPMSRLAQSDSSDKFFDDRASVFDRSRRLILKGSELDYDETVVNSWKDYIASDTLSTFTTNEVEPTVPDEGELLGVDQKRVTVKVPVSFKVLQTRRVNLVDDATTPVVYTVDEKSFDNRAVLTIVQDGDTWKVSNVEDVVYPFTLVSWKSPEDYNEEQFEFVKTGTVESRERD